VAGQKTDLRVTELRRESTKHPKSREPPKASYPKHRTEKCLMWRD